MSIEASMPPGDATCPCCGSLLWPSDELLDFIVAEAYLPELGRCTKQEALQRMLKSLVATGATPENRQPEILELILRRESYGTTGIGRGAAAPHASVKGLPRAIGCVARSTPGIDFESVDNKPVHLLVMLLSPADDDGGHIRRLERISRWLRVQGSV